MRLTKKEVALLSARERALLESDGPWQVKSLVETIKRVRELRDRAADLLRRQTIANRQGRGSKRVAAPNVRSEDKLVVLEKALAHLRAALEAIDAESTRAIAELRREGRGSGSRTATRSAQKPGAGKPGVKPASRKTAAAKPVRGKAPVKRISNKARQPLVRSLPAAGASPAAGQGSRRTRAKKSRKG